MQTVNNTASANRLDIYRNIHKALRGMMADTLVRVGRLDSGDEQEVAEVMAQVRALCAFTVSHLAHEDTHVHPAMERAQPGSTQAAAGEHPQHVAECHALSALADAVLGAGADQRSALAHQLYHALGQFTADSLHHMLLEERDNNAVLWAAFSDQQLFAMEMEIVATLTPEEHGMTLQWMIPSMTPQERLQMLGGVQQGAPVQVFGAMMEALRAHLGARKWEQLAAGLGYEAPRMAA